MSDTPAPADSRRSTRLNISLPIVLHGKDAQQNAFRESTQTLIVNKHGAKLVTSQQLVVGAEILIENPIPGHHGQGERRLGKRQAQRARPP